MLTVGVDTCGSTETHIVGGNLVDPGESHVTDRTGVPTEQVSSGTPSFPGRGPCPCFAGGWTVEGPGLVCGRGESPVPRTPTEIQRRPIYSKTSFPRSSVGVPGASERCLRGADRRQDDGYHTGDGEGRRTEEGGRGGPSILSE